MISDVPVIATNNTLAVTYPYYYRSLALIDEFVEFHACAAIFAL